MLELAALYFAHLHRTAGDGGLEDRVERGHVLHPLDAVDLQLPPVEDRFSELVVLQGQQSEVDVSPGQLVGEEVGGERLQLQPFLRGHELLV